MAACSEKRPVFPTYQGQALKIAVIGEPPAIREIKKVNFTIVQIEELSPEIISAYDALWIRGDSNFEELALSKYASTIESIKVPIVFEEPKKGIACFFDESDGYVNLLDSGSTDYAFVRTSKNSGEQVEAFHLYKEERDLETIRDVYSRILGSVEQYK